MSGATALQGDRSRHIIFDHIVDWLNIYTVVSYPVKSVWSDRMLQGGHSRQIMSGHIIFD